MSILNHRTVVLEPEFKDLEEFMLSIPDLFQKQ